MSTPTWGLDPKSRRISVYYTEESTIYEGMPVCYEFDATTNWLGVASIDFTSTASSITESTTTDEGSHNEGKFIRVEDPDADNINAFAGVVAGADHAGETGPMALDIYIPNGAIVPVKTDQNCTVGRTVLAVHTAEQHLTGPYETAGRPVAVAWETLDNSSAAALVLAKLDPNLFICQKGDATNLIVDDQDTGNTLSLNQIKVDFTTATGNCTALSVQATSSAGAAANGYGLALYAQADVTATPSAHIAGTGIWMNVTGGTPTEYLTALEIGLYEDGATMTSAGRVSLLALSMQVADDVNADNLSYFYCANNGAQVPDNFINVKGYTEIGDAICGADEAGHVIGFDGDFLTRKIPIRFGTVQYYLLAGQAIQGVADA